MSDSEGGWGDGPVMRRWVSIMRPEEVSPSSE